MKTRATSRRVPRQIYAPKQGRGEVSGNEILFCRAGATTESRAAVKFQAMGFCSAAPERQPKAGAWRSFGQCFSLWLRRSDNRKQGAAKTRATSGRVPRQIHAPKQGRGEVPGNEILFCRVGATTESMTR